MLVLNASHMSGKSHEEVVVARTVFIRSNGIMESAKPLPNSCANPYDIKTCHVEGEKKLLETVNALHSYGHNGEE